MEGYHPTTYEVVFSYIGSTPSIGSPSTNDFEIMYNGYTLNLYYDRIFDVSSKGTDKIGLLFYKPTNDTGNTWEDLTMPVLLFKIHTDVDVESFNLSYTRQVYQPGIRIVHNGVVVFDENTKGGTNTSVADVTYLLNPTYTFNFNTLSVAGTTLTSSRLPSDASKVSLYRDDRLMATSTGVYKTFDTYDESGVISDSDTKTVGSSVALTKTRWP